MSKKLAALSIDMDDLWSYYKTAGDSRWESHPSFLHLAMPRLFKLLDKHGFGLTAFVIGQDVRRPAVRPWLAELVRRGHELGNHSDAHDAAIAGLSPQQIHAELEKVEAAVEDEFKVSLRGYRGPSFSYSTQLLEVLAERGYNYDCSTFPTFLGPLARLYHRIVAKGGDQESGSDHLFGSWAEGFRPLKPYRWRLRDKSLMELPTGTMPLLRIPVHGTYLHFLADVSEPLALFYFRLYLGLCRLTRTAPVFLLHASDFLGSDDLDDSGVIPGMRRTAERKLTLMEKVFSMLAQHYQVVDMGTLCAQWPAHRTNEKQPPGIQLT